ncbi:MAG: hypothetical protein ABIY51_07410, partial [Ferruginibacter sp.]
MKQFILAINCLLYLSGTAQVTLYQEKNFSGTAKTLALGQYSLSDFNDMVNSVRVAPGNVIVLYEDAENNKGTGKSIDILEDCPDLNVYNFDKKASFVVVFAAANGNRIWVRNRLENGQFIPGHWEHKRANGSSPNSTVAVVAPAYQPVTPPVVTIDPGTPPPSINPPPGNGTRIRISGDKYVINSLATLSADELATWDHAVTDQNGVLGSDFNGKQIIGSAAFQRKFENGAIGTGANALGASNLNFWYPQKEKGDNSAYPYYKRTLTGNLQWTDIYDNVKSLPDHDLNIDIVPAAGYEYLITKAHPSEKSKLTTAAFTKDGHPLKDCPASYSQIECEID